VAKQITVEFIGGPKDGDEPVLVGIDVKYDSVWTFNVRKRDTGGSSSISSFMQMYQVRYVFKEWRHSATGRLVAAMVWEDVL
jgi:hypothetical protein